MAREKKKNPDFSKRLNDLLLEYKLKPHRFSKSIGVAAATVDPYLKEGRVPEADILLKISELFADNSYSAGDIMVWLMTGRGKKGVSESLVSGHSAGDIARKGINDLILEMDKFKDPTKVKKAMQIIKILGDLPNKKVETLLKVAQGFKEEKRGGE